MAHLVTRVTPSARRAHLRVARAPSAPSEKEEFLVSFRGVRMRARASAVRLFSTLSIIALLSVLGAIAAPAHAQGKIGAKRSVPPGQAKKHVTPGDAVLVTREVLVSHGYTIVRVERVRETQVIYYRRGNNGRGRGLGPVERMVVRPSGTIVVFEAAPERALLDIRVRLGL